MVIAQALAEYGLASAIGSAVFSLGARLQELIGPPGIAWVGIGVGVVVILVFIRR
jgi:hypothetical protein